MTTETITHLDGKALPRVGPSPTSAFGRAVDGLSLLAAAALVAGAVAVMSGFLDEGVGRAAGVLGLCFAAGLTLLSFRFGSDDERASFGLVVAAVAVGAVTGTLGVGWSEAEMGLAFYPLAALGFVLAPSLPSSTAGKLRVWFDAIAAGAAVGFVGLEMAIDDPQAGASTIGVARPLLVALVVAALLVALLRPAPYHGDRRLAALGVAVAAILGADLTVIAGVEAAGVAAGLRLIGAAAAVVATFYLRRAPGRRAVAPLSAPIWKHVLPYTVVVVTVLVAARWLAASGWSEIRVLPYGVVLVAVLSIARQAANVRESRELVEAGRDRLIAAMSRDLRAPLTAVSGFADVVADEWEDLDPVERREMLDIVRSQSGSIAQIVSDMGSLVRDELDETPLAITRVDGKRLIGDAIRLVFDLNNGPLPVRAQVAPYLEFTADRSRLLQILVHLLRNAHQYGGRRILIVAQRTDDARTLEVHDDGPGVPAHYRKVIWDRFERGEHALDEVGGSGLGLAIVAALARAHGGRAGYRRSEKLGGACFFVEVPYDSAVAAAVPQPVAARA